MFFACNNLRAGGCCDSGQSYRPDFFVVVVGNWIAGGWIGSNIGHAVVGIGSNDEYVDHVIDES